jgi:hypothetical protein
VWLLVSLRNDKLIIREKRVNLSYKQNIQSMKTIKLAFVALLAIGLSTATVNAQDAAVKGTAKTPAKKADAGAKTNASGQHLKKDGTPDMRYKENKQAAASTKATKASDKSTTKASGTTGTAAKGKSAKSSTKAAK